MYTVTATLAGMDSATLKGVIAQRLLLILDGEQIEHLGRHASVRAHARAHDGKGHHGTGRGGALEG